MDETGLQLNNKPGYVIAKKGSKNVAALTSSEKGETVTVLSCSNAEGAFLPPCLIFKGKNKKQEFEDGMPPGSKLYMNAKSAYVNTDIFLDWLKTHFVPRKPQGPVVLFLDGHSCHCNSVEMLEYAEANDITLLCFPSHTTQFLQPLDRSFFKSLKSHYNSVCNTFVKTNPTKKINRLSFGKLFDDAWSKSATVENGKGGFKACGLYPFNPSAIPEYAFLTECAFSHSQEEHSTLDKRVLPNHSLSPLPSTSAEEKNITPGTLLEQITPVPSTSSADQVRKRAKQVAMELTSPDHIEKRRKKEEEKATKEVKKTVKAEKRANKENSIKLIKKVDLENAKKRSSLSRKLVEASSSEDSDTNISLSDHSSDDIDENDNAEYAGCGEPYTTTKKQDDWIQCVHCTEWFHEGYSKYINLCHGCGKVLSKTRN
ncbi:uncharacterized protein isoform X1 [Leptinotarsa decemlineata]|uniref:uncharacterized protein isoform X1 n=1 Tax=Leptinotarsa decemlineata TaxID=7539 RepID=UPI003D30A91D